VVCDFQGVVYLIIPQINLRKENLVYYEELYFPLLKLLEMKAEILIEMQKKMLCSKVEKLIGNKREYMIFWKNRSNNC